MTQQKKSAVPLSVSLPDNLMNAKKQVQDAQKKC